jgi:DNA replication protein DnaC
MEMTEKELQAVLIIKKKIVLTHEKCKGVGYLKEEGKVVPCICMQILKYIKNLICSNIPKDYWQLEFGKLKVDINDTKKIKSYYDNIDNAIQNGLGLFISGEQRGIGKTSMACCIAKRAIIKRYNVYFDLMANIINNTFSDEKKIIQRLKDSDLIVIDELDKMMMRDNSPLIKQIENQLRELLPNGKSVIICTNSSLEELDKKLFIGSLLKRYLIISEIKGTDFSIEKNKSLENKLETEYNYFHKNIISAAQEFYKNESLTYEKEFNKHFN